MRKRRPPSPGPYLLEARLDRSLVRDATRFPYHLPVVRGLDVLPFHQKVTFFVGENGSGKSTLLEAIAVEAGLNPEGGSSNFNFSTRASHSRLEEALRLSKSISLREDGYFLRAESYFNVATEIERLDRKGGGGPPLINSYGGVSLHEQSHGESFFALFQHRLKGPGLYLLDEPEAALSPSRQMQFLALLHQRCKAGSQFVIATHSPIILAYPDAWIYQFGGEGPRRVEYAQTEHYLVTRAFLNSPRSALDELLSD